MKTKKTEKQIQTAIIKHLKDEGIYYTKTMRMSMNGVPDILCCVDGTFLGIEVKGEGMKSRLTELQKLNLSKIRASGGYALCTDNLEDVKRTIETIQAIREL